MIKYLYKNFLFRRRNCLFFPRTHLKLLRSVITSSLSCARFVYLYNTQSAMNRIVRVKIRAMKSCIIISLKVFASAAVTLKGSTPP